MLLASGKLCPRMPGDHQGGHLTCGCYPFRHNIVCTLYLSMCAVLLEWTLAISWSHYYSNRRLSCSSKPTWQEVERQKDHVQISAGLLPALRIWISFLLLLCWRSNPQLLMCPKYTGLHSLPVYMSLSLLCCETVILSIRWILCCLMPLAPGSWDLLEGGMWVLNLASAVCIIAEEVAHGEGQVRVGFIKMCRIELIGIWWTVDGAGRIWSSRQFEKRKRWVPCRVQDPHGNQGKPRAGSVNSQGRQARNNKLREHSASVEEEKTDPWILAHPDQTRFNYAKSVVNSSEANMFREKMGNLQYDLQTLSFQGLR